MFAFYLILPSSGKRWFHLTYLHGQVYCKPGMLPLYLYHFVRIAELAGIDRGVLMRALRLLEQKGKAAIFTVPSAGGGGVEFSV